MMTLMIYILNALVTIGNVQLSQVHRVEVVQGVQQLSNTARIEVARNVREFQGGNGRLEQHLRVGDAVCIDLGYGAKTYTEFEGYVTHIGAKEPLVISCEDRMYLLRKERTKNKVYQNVSLRSFLSEVVPRKYKVVCRLEMTLEQMKVEDSTVYDVLAKLKDEPFGVYSSFYEDTLYVGFAYDVRVGAREVRYEVGRVADNALEYVSEEAKRVRVKAVSHLPGGKKKVLELGDADGSLRTLNYYGKTEAEMRMLAKEEMKRMRFSGYEGSITGFGYPRTEAGDVLWVVDEKYPDRDGKYLIDEVEVSFGMEGYRRKNKLSRKV